MRKKSVSFSPFQGKMVYSEVMKMLIENPDLFDRMPGVTPEQREAYESRREREKR